MSGDLAILPIWQFFDQDGNPLVNGSVEWFQAGTQNRVMIYADIGLTTPLLNPVPLDAAGRPRSASGPTAVWLDNDKAYKMVHRDAEGRVLWTADNIVAPGTGAPGPAGPPGPPGADGSVNTNYSEGNWTPVLASAVDGSAGTGTVYDGQYGHWTRIGRNVFVTGRLRLSHLGTWADNPILMIGGLPFPPAHGAGWDVMDIGGLVMTYFYSLGITAPAPSDWASMLGTAMEVPPGFFLSGFDRAVNLHEYLRAGALTDTTDCAFTGFYLTTEEPAAEGDMTLEQVIGDGGSITLPDGYTQHIIYATNSQPLTLSGVLGAPKVGTRLVINAAGSAPVYLTPDSGGNHPGAFINPVSSGPLPLNRGLAEYIFSVTDGNRWLMVSHRQGLPITRDAAPWMYGTAIGSPGATWIVDPSQVVAQRYELRGSNIRVWIEIATSTFTGSGGVLLINDSAWAGFVPTLNTEFAGLCVVTQDGVHAICWAWITDNNSLRIENLTGEFQTSSIGLNLMVEFEVQ